MKYKVGDKVRYLKNTTNSNAVVGNKYYIYEINEVGYILTSGKGYYEVAMRVNKDDVELIKEYTRGELVEVSDGNEHWYKRIYLTNIEGALYPIVVVNDSYEDEFNNGEKFDNINWKYIRKINQEQEQEQEEIDKAIQLLKDKGMIKDGLILTK